MYSNDNAETRARQEYAPAMRLVKGGAVSQPANTPHVRLPLDFVQSGVLARAGNAIGVYLSLYSHSDADGWCWPSRSTIATEAGVSLRAASYQINKLKALGFIVETLAGGGDDHTKYKVAMPDELVYQCKSCTGANSAPGKILHGGSANLAPASQLVPVTSTKIDTLPRGRTRTHEDEPAPNPHDVDPDTSDDLAPNILRAIDSLVSYDLAAELQQFNGHAEEITDHIVTCSKLDRDARKTFSRRRPATPWKSVLRTMREMQWSDVSAALAFQRTACETSTVYDIPRHLANIIEGRWWERAESKSGGGKRKPSQDTPKIDAEYWFTQYLKFPHEQYIRTELGIDDWFPDEPFDAQKEIRTDKWIRDHTYDPKSIRLIRSTAERMIAAAKPEDAQRMTEHLERWCKDHDDILESETETAA